MILDTRLRKNLDIPLIALTYTLALIGIVVLFSATHGDPTAYHKKQMIWLIIGTVGLVFAALYDYHRCARFAGHLYVLNLLMLTAVLKVAPSVNGAARWISIGGFKLQPSEFAKLIVIITLAVFLTRREETIREFKTVLQSLLYVAVPMGLIFKQPDLGTALVLLAIWLGMVFIAGAQLKHLAAIVLTGVLLFTVMWHSGKIKEYQKDRLIAFINPEADPKETGYHVLQARIAIGSGGMWGKGLLHSTQVRGGYIPEKQTDFIFTTIGEELGFAGSVLVTVLYGAMILRGITIVGAADEDYFGKLTAAGVVTMLAFHIVVNIGMNIGIMPVAGVPLPLISAGGSNMILTLICIGLLESVALNRHQLLF